MLTKLEAQQAIRDLSSKYENLLYGECVVFALALHRLSKLPLYGIVGFDDDVESDVLIHSYVRLNTSIVIDIKGPRSFEEMYQDFESDAAVVDAEEISFSTKELLKLGLGTSKCPTLHVVLPIAAKILDLTKYILN